MKTQTWDTNPTRCLIGAAVKLAGVAVILIGITAVIAGCPRSPDPPKEPPLMDSVPRVGPEWLLTSQADVPDRPSTVRDPDYVREPVPDPEGVSELPRLEEELVEVEIPNPPVFSRADPRDGVQPERDWRELRFASGAHRPEPGLDPELVEVSRLLAEEGREEVYAFLLMEEYLVEPGREVLEELGVRVLGDHDNVYKVAIPLEPLETAKKVAELGFVYWVGMGPSDLRLSPELQQLMEELEEISERDAPAEVPLYLNLFDEDPTGQWRNELEAEYGLRVGEFDPDLLAYRVMGPWEAVNAVVGLDYVLFAEPILEIELDYPDEEARTKHDESTPLIGADYIRSNYDGSPIVLGIMDTGFMVGSAAPTMHWDLNKWGYGRNFTSDGTSVWNDTHGHGTHVLGTIAGTGSADIRYRGVAPGLGSSNATRIQAAQVFTGTGSGLTSWTRNAMDWLTNRSAHVINYSGGGYWGSALAGTDSSSRKLDANVWKANRRPLFVIAAGNSGPGEGTIGTPAVAKNALTVGSVYDYGFQNVGTIRASSSRGPTADNRVKPNLTAPGLWIRSARAGTSDEYTDMSGTSMAAPHVAGVAAGLMEHYPVFRRRPHLARAWLMATANLYQDDITLSEANTYGLGRVSAYKAHWQRNNPRGWLGYWGAGSVHRHNYMYRDIDVPKDAKRLVVVMTWDEPPASAGASMARRWDLELWAEPPGTRYGGPANPWDNVAPYRKWSWQDNVLSLIIEEPAAGRWRLKTVPYNAPHRQWHGYSLPVGIGAVVILGDTQPDMALSASVLAEDVQVGDTFVIRTNVSSPSYVAFGAHLRNTVLPNGVKLVDVSTTRKDGVTMSFGANREFTLGSVVQGSGGRRTVDWTFEAESGGCHDIGFRAWSENGGTRETTVTVCVEGDSPIIIRPPWWEPIFPIF